jgi:hypothetical protein
VVAVTFGAGPATSRRLTTRRVLALGALVAVLGLAVSGRPWITLYDGVLPAEPYRWLDPPPGHPGDPQSASATIPVTDGGSPLVAVATPELVPQAQLFAIPKALLLPPGSTQLTVSITAVEPPALPTDSHIAGNVYAITVTNQAGQPATADPAAEVSIVLRAPDPSTATARLARFDGTNWQPFTSEPAGVGAVFSAVVTDFGDFAVLLPGPADSSGASAAAVQPSGSTNPTGPTEVATASAAPGGTGLDRTTLNLALGGLAVLIVVLVALAALLPSRRRPPPGARPPTRAPPRPPRT